jgi:hypothetical protein
MLSNALTLALLLLLAATPATAQQFTHATGSADVIAKLSIRSGEIGGGDARTVTVYGDGRVRAHYPAYLKNAGTRDVQLSPAELRSLIASLAGSGLPEFDATAVKADCAAREAARGEVFHTAGADLIEIELNLDGYTKAGRAPATLRKRVTWKGLPQAVRVFPEVTALRDLASARDALVAVLARPDLAVAR